MGFSQLREKERSRHKVCLYDAGWGSAADLTGIAAYLSHVPGVEVALAGDITSKLAPDAMPQTASPDGLEMSSDAAQSPSAAARPLQPRTLKELAKALALTRVHNPNKRDSFGAPLPAEVRFLERQLERAAPSAFGHLYDGMAAMSVLRSLLRPDNELHLVFTNQVIGTWDDGDLRYHARVFVAGSPSIISVPGVVLAPARPREYYLYQGGARAAGASEDEIEMKMLEVLGDRYIVHGDSRIPEILKGCALQAVAYWLFAEAFCDDPDCRLFNAHWQEEMIRAQLGGGHELCPRHAQLLGFEG